MSVDMEFVGGPLDGEHHEVSAGVGTVTRMVDVPRELGTDPALGPLWQAVTYERGISAVTGQPCMRWLGPIL